MILEPIKGFKVAQVASSRKFLFAGGARPKGQYSGLFSISQNPLIRFSNFSSEHMGVVRHAQNGQKIHSFHLFHSFNSFIHFIHFIQFIHFIHSIHSFHSFISFHSIHSFHSFLFSGGPRIALAAQIKAFRGHKWSFTENSCF